MRLHTWVVLQIEMWCSTAIEYSDYYLVQALMVFPFSITARVTYMSYERENQIHQEMLTADVGVVPSPFFISFEA